MGRRPLIGWPGPLLRAQRGNLPGVAAAGDYQATKDIFLVRLAMTDRLGFPGKPLDLIVIPANAGSQGF